jgi:hypothetical protein
VEEDCVKTPVVIRKEYIMYLELFDNMLWFHTDVNKWSSAVKRKFLQDMRTLVGLIGMPLLAFVEASNKKLMKFAEVLGMTKEQKVTASNEEQAFIYCWR